VPVRVANRFSMAGLMTVPFLSRGFFKISHKSLMGRGVWGCKKKKKKKKKKTKKKQKKKKKKKKKKTKIKKKKKKKKKKI